jgi:putative ABC transport system permease protein
MNYTDIIALALRNLRQAKLRTFLTVIGVIVGVAAIVTLVSFGIGLQQNIIGQALSKLDVFTQVTVRGASADALLEMNEGRTLVDEGGENDTAKENPDEDAGKQPESEQSPARRQPRRVLGDEAVAEIQLIKGVKYVLPAVNFWPYVRFDGRVRRMGIGGAPAAVEDNPRFRKFLAGRAFSSDDAQEAIVNEDFLASYTAQYYRDRRAGRPRNDGPFRAAPTKSEAERAEAAKKALGKEITVLTPRHTSPAPTSVFGIPLLSPQPEDLNDDPEKEQKFEQHSFQIVGVIPSEGGFNISPFLNTRLMVPIEVAKRFRETNRDPMEQLSEALAGDSGYQFAEVRVSDPTQVKPVMEQLDKMGFRSFSITTQMDEINRIFLIVNSSLALIGGIALLVASFGISNTMIMSIRERTREIGIMKAIGGSDSEIMRIFFIEASLIGLTGGVIGVVCGWGIDLLANTLANRWILRQAGATVRHIEFFSIPWYLWGGAILFAVLVSLIAAIYPAMRAAKVDPIKALRYE